jgi:carbon-monoxide dehydrogenase small subunit
VNRVGVEFELNGRRVSAWVRPEQTVLEVLRDETGATEVKYGCGEGVCGTCTVLLDGAAVNSCLMLAPQVDGRSVTTLRGLARDGEEMHPLQESFLKHGGSQCGFCTPGMILMAYALLEESKGASREEIREAIAGNLCRCTGYTKIVDAVESYTCAPRTGQPSTKIADAKRIDESDVS